MDFVLDILFAIFLVPRHVPLYVRHAQQLQPSQLAYPRINSPVALTMAAAALPAQTITTQCYPSTYYGGTSRTVAVGICRHEMLPVVILVRIVILPLPSLFRFSRPGRTARSLCLRLLVCFFV